MSDAIALSQSNAQWSIMFEDAKAELASIFDATPLKLEHMGSTSVPGLAAKPVIDIILLVDDMAPVLGKLHRLETLGYEYRPDVSNPERLFFRRFGPNGGRTHHLHVHTDAVDFGRYLLFRDVLRANADVVRDYEALKAELAKAFPDNREAYSSGKNDFIDATIAQAGGPPRKAFWNK